MHQLQRPDFHMRALWLIAMCLAIDLQPISAAIRINELVASNGSVLADEDGEYADWIEIINTATHPINLAGYGLSDNPGEPYRWVFPDVQLAPDEYRVVFASGKNRREPTLPLHTNFSISAEGEPLVLTRPDGVEADRTEAVPLGRDHAYGRYPDGNGDWYYFAEPTAGGPNVTQPYLGWLQPPQFSHHGGFHTAAFSLTLSAPDSEADILYTLDGSEPDAAGAGRADFHYKNAYPGSGSNQLGPLLEWRIETHAYAEPLTVTDRSTQFNRLTRVSSTGENYPPNYIPGTTTPLYKGTVVRARAVRDGWIPSPIVTHTYFITPAGDARYSLPVLSVVIPEHLLFGYERGIYTAGAAYDSWWLNYPEQHSRSLWQRPANYTGRGDAWEVPGHFELFVPGSGRVLGQNVGYRVHGGASRSYPQKSLRAYARRAYDTDDHFRYPLFDDPPIDPAGKPVEAFRRLLLRIAGNDFNRSRFRDGFLHALLRPLGLDDQRFQPAVQFINGDMWGIVNIRERIDQHYIAGRHAIHEEDVDVLEARAALLIDELDEPDPAEAAAEADFDALRSFIGSNNMADPALFAQAAAQMDMDNFILYNVSHIYVDNRDWPHNNNRYWRKRSPDQRREAPPQHDGRWRWILNDMDFGFGLYGGAANASYNTLTHATNPNPSPGWDGTDRSFSTVMLRGLLANRAFRDRFINAFLDHLSTSFLPARAHALIDAHEAAIGPLRDGEHRSRWGAMMSSDTHVAVMKDFATQRHAAMWGHIRSFFSLAPFPLAEVRFDVSHAAAGSLAINTLTVATGGRGLPDPDNPWPFRARYYPGIEIEVTARPNPGWRFAGWREFPDHAEPTLRLAPATGLAVTALFEETPVRLLAYWNFNDTAELTTPQLARTEVSIAVDPGPTTAVTNGSANGFAAQNARGGDPAGSHLRINNPLGASLLLRLPTTGHGTPVLTYETRRSGQGAGIQVIELSLDGHQFEPYTELVILDDDPQRQILDFSNIEGAADNPALSVRISFLQGAGGVAGNNRIDNLTLEAIALPGHDSTRHTHYSSWRWDAFPDPTERADPTRSGPLATPRNDGIANLLRYALAIPLDKQADDHLPRILARPDGFELAFHRDPAQRDIRLRLLKSADLTLWSEAETLTDDSLLQPGSRRIALSHDPATILFYRFVVEPAQP
jgi:hypothetical protein